MLQQPCAGLFMDPGLGKTSITLSTVSILLQKQYLKHVLVVAPLRVVYSVWPQEVEKWDEFRHLSVGILHGPKKHKVLDEDYDIYLINPEGLLWLRDTGRYTEFDGLVVDECFVAGTEVTTAQGSIAIEDVVVGDEVLTSKGWSRVTNVFQGCASATVRVDLSNGKSFECTPNHEIYTQEEGWIPARNLSNHTLVDVSDLSQEVPGVSHNWWPRSSILLQNLRGGSQTWASKLEQRRTYVEEVARQAFGLLTENWASTTRAGRQWAWAYGMRAACVGGATDRLGVRACSGYQEWVPPAPLQTGFGEPGAQDLCRGRRRDAQVFGSSPAGSSERQVASGPRVVGISHRQRDCSIPVFDIEVAGAHEYSVAGVRVHNSTKFKHTNTRRFKAMRKMIRHFDRRYILTGTPAPNGLLDLFGQIYLLDGGASLGQYVSHYRAQYFQQIDGGYLWVPREGAKQQIHEKIAPLVMRLDQNDYLQMPHQKVTDIWVDMPASAMKAYKELESLFITQLQAGEIVAANAAVASHKLRQIASGGVYVDTGDERVVQHLHDAKTEACKDLVEQFQGQPTIIAYDTHHDLERLQKAFGKDLPYIGGGVSANRGNDLASLWNQGKLPVLALHPASAAHGLNLQHGGCHCIWYTLTWDLEQYDQLIRRIWRQGQDRNVVFIYHLLARGTIDQVVGRRLLKKDAEQRSLLDSLREYYLDRTQVLVVDDEKDSSKLAAGERS